MRVGWASAHWISFLAFTMTYQWRGIFSQYLRIGQCNEWLCPQSTKEVINKYNWNSKLDSLFSFSALVAYLPTTTTTTPVCLHKNKIDRIIFLFLIHFYHARLATKRISYQITPLNIPNIALTIKPLSLYVWPVQSLSISKWLNKDNTSTGMSKNIKYTQKRMNCSNHMLITLLNVTFSHL